MQDLKKEYLHKLLQRQKDGSFRSLNNQAASIDYYSNDYLGFARDNELKSKIAQESEVLHKQGYTNFHGSTGSRLISGNSNYITDLESNIANFHHNQAALIFNSGYAANLGLFSCLGTKHVTYIYDEYCHASIIDGMRLGFASKIKYKHNDLQDLENILIRTTGIIYIVTEAVFSMDGDLAPLQEICKLAENHDAQVIVDEAHSFGIFGSYGNGLVHELNLSTKVFASIYTFGKSLGSHGAAITGNKELIEYLINFSRSFIYTTAPSLSQIISIKCGYDKLKTQDYTKLMRLKNQTFAQKLKDIYGNYNPSQSCIHSLIIADREKTLAIADKLNQEGINSKAILAPTVPKHAERIRICNHLFNTEDQENQFMWALKNAI